ncbi:DDB1- and CUL4-associated factor 5 isoform X2 [Drosophila obscura]|uniref:DDB1- and CUL4-associated factor 5 isoform X2 n=1 Tax=Drosophila obscura TaxID=7282 RepID=UPI001BB1811C|nr:DDB1- and CUL4-associated factor 5 isoform X2 [Drosophila obscura]
MKYTYPKIGTSIVHIHRMNYARGSRSVECLNLDVGLRQRENDLVAGQLSAGIFRQRLSAAENLYQRNLTGHYGCVNALEFSNGGQFLASGGDDKRVLLWNIDQEVVTELGRPQVMNETHTSNIFCLGFDTFNAHVFSGGNDDLVIQHDLATGKLLNYFSHEGPVYGLSVDRTSVHLFSVATESGEVLFYDLRVGNYEPLTVAKFRSPFNAVEFHPLNGNFLATANAKRGAMLWDLRHHNHPLCQFNYIPESPSCMSVRFNCSGSLLLTLHRRLPPILFSPSSPEPVGTFYHDEYFNSCTMKSCSFAGPQDEMVVSGSDNFNMFIWRLDGVDLEAKNQWIDTPPVILTGHRSVVNQVRFNRQRCLLASSGVEKIIKLWSPFAQHGWEGSLMYPSSKPYCNRTLHNNTTEHVIQDFSSCDTDEDQVMLAFFDTLVQRELESWNTNGNHTSSDSTSSSTSSERSEAGASAASEEEEEEPTDDEDDTPNVSELSWQTHPNRIFYLIAKKRRALLQMAVKGTGGQQRSVEQLLARLNGEQKQAATQARISDWLDETHRLFGDDEMPTTSAEAAAREQRRRVFDQLSRNPRKAPQLKPSSDTLQSNYEQMERKRKLMRLRFASRKRRRNTLRLRASDLDNDSIEGLEEDPTNDSDEEGETEEEDAESEDNNNNNNNNNGTDGLDTAAPTAVAAAAADDTDDTSSTSMTSMEAQLSQAPSTSSSYPFHVETEANNNNQMAANNNHKPPATTNGTAAVDMCSTESSSASTSSSSQAAI